MKALGYGAFSRTQGGSNRDVLNIRRRFRWLSPCVLFPDSAESILLSITPGRCRYDQTH